MAGSTQRGAHLQNMNLWGRTSYINYNKFIKCMAKGLFLVELTFASTTFPQIATGMEKKLNE